MGLSEGGMWTLVLQHKRLTFPQLAQIGELTRVDPVARRRLYGVIRFEP